MISGLQIEEVDTTLPQVSWKWHVISQTSSFRGQKTYLSWGLFSLQIKYLTKDLSLSLSWFVLHWKLNVSCVLVLERMWCGCFLNLLVVPTFTPTNVVCMCVCACVCNFLSIIHFWKMYLSHIPMEDPPPPLHPPHHNRIFLYPAVEPSAKFNFYFLLAQHNMLLFKTLSKEKTDKWQDWTFVLLSRSIWIDTRRALRGSLPQPRARLHYSFFMRIQQVTGYTSAGILRVWEICHIRFCKVDASA